MSVTAIDIVGCGVFSPAGSGLAPLAAALAGPATAPPAVPEGPDAPGGEGFPGAGARAVTDFRPAERLGTKGLSRLTRTDQLGMAACGQALEQLDRPLADEERPRTGIVLGSGAGSVRRLAEFTRDTFVQDRPYMVNPSHFPGTLMNSAAGQTAIRFGITGVNATLAGGPVAGLSALRYARNTLLNDHADRLLAGSVEELSAQSAWAWERSGRLSPGIGVGEGGAVFVLERDAERPLARLLACELRFAAPGQGAAGIGRRLSDAVRDALKASDVAAGDVGAVAVGGAGRRGWSAVEERALRDVFDGPGPERLRVQPVVGETHSAAASLQLAGLLARWQAGAADERVGLVTALGPDGQVGCLVVQRG
ncbi:beta-ketoacyl synthase N-terminal-like domain-containing protein [Nocardiopsis mangrovi]|uniref:Beta-ketoacyl synthase N-terminal-like domain-containing protein n=1 Tax=Nocardiopsis mangrovi TaxID=1179818 RepID=A0ABV9E1L2_9ACTN